MERKPRDKKLQRSNTRTKSKQLPSEARSEARSSVAVEPIKLRVMDQPPIRNSSVQPKSQSRKPEPLLFGGRRSEAKSKTLVVQTSGTASKRKQADFIIKSSTALNNIATPRPSATVYSVVLCLTLVRYRHRQ